MTRGSSSYASRIRSVRLTLPKGMRIIRNSLLERRLSVRAQKAYLPVTQVRVGKRSLLVDKIAGGPVTKVLAGFKRKLLRSSGSLRSKGRKGRATFKVQVGSYGGSTYNYKVKVRPKS